MDILYGVMRFMVFIAAIFLVTGCGIFENEKKEGTPNTIFGTWELEEIRYDNGETVTPNSNEPYWFELSEDSILAEGEYHPSLEGQSFCNPCFGYFDYDEKTQEIKIAFICERLVCGIATEFASAVPTSYKYDFTKGLLILTFEYPTQEVSPNSGVVLLKPQQ